MAREDGKRQRPRIRLEKFDLAVLVPKREAGQDTAEMPQPLTNRLSKIRLDSSGAPRESEARFRNEKCWKFAFERNLGSATG